MSNLSIHLYLNISWLFHFGVGVVSHCLLPVGIVSGRMSPIHVIELDLHEVPMYLFVHLQHTIEHFNIAMKGPAEMPDSSPFPFFEQEIEHPILYETPVEQVHSAATYAVQEVISSQLCTCPGAKKFMPPRVKS